MKTIVVQTGSRKWAVAASTRPDLKLHMVIFYGIPSEDTAIGIQRWTEANPEFEAGEIPEPWRKYRPEWL